MARPKILRNLLLLPLLTSFPFVSWAQTLTSATIAGIITDSSGAVVPNASVKITQTDNGAVRDTTSDSAGGYRFTFLKPGDYRLTAAAAGLRSATVEVQLLVGQEQAVDIKLSVQDAQQTINVTASTLLQTENGNQLTTHNQQYIENTPINGGDITNIAFTTPGLRLNVGGGNANFNVNGLPFNSVLFTVNGADIVEPYNLNNKSGSSNNTLGANDIAEAAVIVNAYSAQYGREAGAQVNYITKSGGNRYHGNLVENYNSNILNANDYFNNLSHTPRARAVANQYAASIGGPIKRDKLTFFANTEGLRYILPTNGVVSLPSPQLQTYILSHVPTASTSVYKSLFGLENATPGISRAVPVTTGSQPLEDSTGHLGCGTQTFTGTPTGTGGTFGLDTPCAVAFGTTVSGADTEYYISGRIDYNINNKQKVYVRVSFDNGLQPSLVSPISPVFNEQSQQPWIIPQINYTYVITPRLVNNFILNGNWYGGNGKGSPNFPEALSLLPASLSFSDGGANGGALASITEALPTGRRGQQLGVIDDLSWDIAKHTLQAGINDRNNRVTDSSIAASSIAGTYTFTDLTDFANGVLDRSQILSTYTQAYPLFQAVHTRLNSLDFYGQDEWKLRRNLNIIYGVRFEYQGNPSCKENCFTRANAAFLAPDYQAGSSVPYNSTLQTGLRKTFQNFEGIITEPRFSIAYSPFRDHGTVIRGGLGLFANTIPGSLTANVFGNSPNKFSPTVETGFVGAPATAGSAQADALASSKAFEAGFSAGDTLTQLKKATLPATFSTPSLYVNPETYHTIRAFEWSAEVEQLLTARDLFTLIYSGNHGYDEPISNLDANAYTGNAALYPNGFSGLGTSAPDPRFGPVTQIYTDGYSNYNGLTVAERHELSHGFQGQVSYTWSHALQFGTIYNPTNFPTATGPDRSQTSGQYGPTIFDTRHNLEGDLVYQQPRFGRQLVNSIAGGWIFSGKIYVYSGRPFTVTNSKIATSINPTTFGGSIMADVLSPSILGTHCGKAAVRTACLSTSEFANVATNAVNGQRDFGNSAPNSFRGPGYFSIASQVSKGFPITEAIQFELGAQAYNLTNHTNLAVPNSNLGASGFGTITSTVSSPTSIYGTGQGATVSGRVVVVFGKLIF